MEDIHIIICFVKLTGHKGTCLTVRISIIQVYSCTSTFHFVPTGKHQWNLQMLIQSLISAPGTHCGWVAQGKFA